MPSPKIASQRSRVLIADDHAIFRQGLRLLLEAEPDMSVVGEARNGAEAIALTRELTPDLLLLDVAMPGQSGLEVARQLREAGTTTRVILLTAALSRAEVPRALKLGVRGVVAKESPIDLLLKAIRAVHSGEFWVGREVIGDLVDALVRPAAEPSRAGEKSPFGLTRRERELVNLVAVGCSNKDIARKCFLREDTVKHHMSSIFDKTGVSTRLELALFALHNGLTT
jgi:two-component system, NarL family, nitrate/nitrite response regulator NarL